MQRLHNLTPVTKYQQIDCFFSYHKIKKWLNEGLNVVYKILDLIYHISKVIWVEHVARIDNKENVYIILVGKPLGTDHWEIYA